MSKLGLQFKLQYNTNQHIYIIGSEHQRMAANNKQEQEMREQIASYLRKKDYYDILGLSRSCTEPDIKKAYKKLALRFHPDKNSIQGSKEVFKKVSNAYSNLIDAEKRATYDRYGPEEDRQPQYRPQRQYRQGYTQEDEFEDIFRAFFGGVPMRNGYRANGYQHFTFHNGNPHQQQQRVPSISLIYIVGIFMVLYIIPALFSSKSEPYYSLTPTSSHRFKLTTRILQNPYFVKQQYMQNNKNNKYTNQVELAVDTEYISKYSTQCNYHRNGYYASTSVRNQWRNSCARLDAYVKKNAGYVRQIIYGY